MKKFIVHYLGPKPGFMFLKKQFQIVNANDKKHAENLFNSFNPHRIILNIEEA